MASTIRIALRTILLTLLLLGVLYPIALTGLAALLFPDASKGSLIERNGSVVGSRLIAQSFTSERYFHPRPSASDHDAMKSGASNLAPTSEALITDVRRRRADLIGLEGLAAEDTVPADAVTSSGSGLDPHISPANARMQVARIAKARNLSERTLEEIVESHIEQRQFGVLGEVRINVLELNLDLDAISSGGR